VRILFVTPELPNQFHRIRALNLLCGLNRHHEVDLVSLTHRTPRPEDVEALRPLCRRVDWVVQPLVRSLVQCSVGLFRPEPLEVSYEWSPRLERRLQERLAERSYDVLYVKRLRMAEYGLASQGLPRILDLTDSMERFYDLARRRASLKTKALFWEEWIKHRWYEPRVAAQFDRCVVCSPVDAAYLQKHSRLHNVEVVPNAVDTEYFHPMPEAEEAATFLLSGLML
jgi:glycosyltransferase involved in cell wall biosynthesis